MATKYNLEIRVSKNDLIPKVLYEESVRQIENAGLTGKKHVNHFGRICDGFDDKCGNYVSGEFELSYFGNIDLTARELLDEAKFKISGFDEAGMELLDSSERLLDLLSKEEPSINVIPLNIYSQMPVVESMEMNLACGKQRMHLHCKNGGFLGIIQLWKPKKDKYFYDFDSFKEYLFSNYLKIESEIFRYNSDFYESRKNKNLLGIVKGVLLEPFFYLKEKKRDRFGELYIKVISNPDSIERVF